MRSPVAENRALAIAGAGRVMGDSPAPAAEWGRPIASYQLVQEKIAKIYTARSIMHALLMRQLEADHKGVPLSMAEASASKLYCARTTTECALDAVQIMGGAGYMTGSVVEMMARDAKLFQIGGGTDEIQILRIAREVLEKV